MHRPACAKPARAAPEEGQRSALGCPDIHRGQGRSSGVQRGGSRSSLEIYNLGATASWEPDFWGINKRTNENARANEDRAKAQLADAQVSLSAQVAQAYVNLRDAQNRAVMVAQVVTLREQALGLVRQRHGAGVATLADVARYEGDMRSAMAQAAPIRAQVEVAMNQLAVLTGKAPGELDAALAQAPLPVLPAKVAVGDPADLSPGVPMCARPNACWPRKRRRSAWRGRNCAPACPSPAFWAWRFLDHEHRRSGDSGLWHPAPDQMVRPRLGQGTGQRRAGQGPARQREAQYRRAVLTALEDAESSLSRFGAARERLMHWKRAKARPSQRRLGAQRVSAGTSSGWNRPNAKPGACRRPSPAQGRAEVVVDYIAVNKALGLGWEG
jgi:hypothetical protein